MVRLLKKNRESNILTPSQLPCLSRIPTINITSGCCHGCIYCYTKGYSQYPGDGSVILFSNTAQKLADELSRKRKTPKAVYFCPSCDPFQPVPEILDETYRAMKMLLISGIGVQFLTKAAIPDEFVRLFANHNELVCCQIGLTTTNDSLRKIFEPATASVTEKVESLQKLREIGITTSVRADPLVYGLMDYQDSLKQLFNCIADVGIKEIAVSYLFLRPAIKKSLERNLKDKMLLQKILQPYSKSKAIRIGLNNSKGYVLPEAMRVESFRKIRNIASDFGLSVHICGCKNSDITTESCRIIRLVSNSQRTLF